MKRQFLSGEDVLYNFMQAWKQDHVTEYNAIEKKSYGIFIRSQILLLKKKSANGTSSFGLSKLLEIRHDIILSSFCIDFLFLS